MNLPDKQPQRWLWWAKLVFRLLVFALVAGGIAYTIANSHKEFQKHRFSLADVHYGWLAVSGGIYLLGMVPWWLYWHQTLRALGQRPAVWDSFSAYFLSQLGKYMPGKALVVVIRSDAIRGPRVDATVAAASVFVETLTMLAVGALLAAAILAVMFRQQPLLVLLAVGLGLCVGVPTLPPIFRRLVKLLQVRRANPKIDEALAGLNFRLMASGWPGLVLGWFLMGLSLWATLKSMRDPSGSLDNLARVIPMLTACTALALVAGFLSFLPGGAGVREIVIFTLLAEPFGKPTAAVSAVLLRVTWLVAELILATILYGISLARRRLKKTPTASDSARDIHADK